LNIVFDNENSIVQNWTFYGDVEEKKVHTFKLTRVN